MGALDRSEHMQRRPLLQVAKVYRHLARLAGGGEGLFELRPGLRQLHAELLEPALGVIDADDLADLRQTIKITLAEGLAVLAVGRVLQY